MKLFAGLEQANLVVQNDLLRSLWDRISELRSETDESSSSLRYKISVEPKWTVVTLKLERRDSNLVSSIDSNKCLDFLEFLRGKAEFTIDRDVIDPFHEHRDELSRLRNQIREIKEDKPKPLIITGNYLGGAIASLFTLWLLDSADLSKKKRPICVTFGSPLIGDASLSKALYKHSPWCSNFLHVVSTQDLVTKMFANEEGYTPFGTFLLCSDSGCSCFEDPENILTLLAETSSRIHGCNEPVDYGKVVKDLKRKVLFKNTSHTDCTKTSLYQFVSSLLPETRELDHLVEEMEKREKKFQMGKRTVKLDKKLNDSKINMAKVEWYKLYMRNAGIGYYDSYKDMRFMRDINIQECVMRLKIYWADLVKEADMKPQSDGKTLRDRWLFAGLNYMRLVEPLHIAEYYSHEGCSGYKENEKRLEHFSRLEKLVAEEQTDKKYQVSVDQKKKRISAILTSDSRFWEKVEEAVLLCKAMKRKEASDIEKKDCKSKLKDFECKVLELLKNYDVSPEIFLEQSSFIQWWKDYKEAMGSTYTSTLNDIMVNGKYKKYSKGELEI